MLILLLDCLVFMYMEALRNHGSTKLSFLYTKKQSLCDCVTLVEIMKLPRNLVSSVIGHIQHRT